MVSKIAACGHDIHLYPRDELQASPGTKVKSPQNLSVPFVICGFEGAVSHTLFPMMGHMSQRLDGSLFSTLEKLQSGVLQRDSNEAVRGTDSSFAHSDFSSTEFSAAQFR